MSPDRCQSLSAASLKSFLLHPCTVHCAFCREETHLPLSLLFNSDTSNTYLYKQQEAGKESNQLCFHSDHSQNTSTTTQSVMRKYESFADSRYFVTKEIVIRKMTLQRMQHQGVSEDFRISTVYPVLFIQVR